MKIEGNLKDIYLELSDTLGSTLLLNGRLYENVSPQDKELFEFILTYKANHAHGYLEIFKGMFQNLMEQEQKIIDKRFEEQYGQSLNNFQGTKVTDITSVPFAGNIKSTEMTPEPIKNKAEDKLDNNIDEISDECNCDCGGECSCTKDNNPWSKQLHAIKNDDLEEYEEMYNDVKGCYPDDIEK